MARLRCRHARGAGVSLFMVLFCVRWGLDQIVVGIAITLTCEGATALIFESEFAESRPHARRDRQGRDPAARRPPGRRRQGRVERQPLHAAARRLHRPWPHGARRRGCCAAPTSGSTSVPPATAGRARRRRGQRLRHARRGRCSSPARWPAWAVPSCRSSWPEASRTPSSAGAGFIAIVFAMLARGRPLWILIGTFLFGLSLSFADWAAERTGSSTSTPTTSSCSRSSSSSLVLVIFGRRAYLPAALALPYERGSR